MMAQEAGEKQHRQVDQGHPPPAHLRTRELATVFRDTTSSYKYFWFLALIDLLPEFGEPVPIGRVVDAMILRAWAAVIVFRLSLGKVDRLQDCARAPGGDGASGSQHCRQAFAGAGRLVDTR